MATGRLKAFPSLVKYLEERRLYRRDETNQIVKDRDHLQDATRCLLSGESLLRPKPRPISAKANHIPVGGNSWMMV